MTSTSFRLLQTPAVKQVDGEGDVGVGEQVPACSVEEVAFDADDGDAFRGEACGLPGFAVGSPGEQGVMSDK